MYTTEAGSELPRAPERVFTVGPDCQNPTQQPVSWFCPGSPTGMASVMPAGPVGVGALDIAEAHATGERPSRDPAHGTRAAFQRGGDLFFSTGLEPEDAVLGQALPDAELDI